MTWVIGRPGPFGFAVGLSDIRVTLADGSEKDCLQKIYKIGDHVALGFAGSVKFGFEMVAQLANSLPPPPQKGVALIPQAVAEELPKGASAIFKDFPESERRLGSALMLLSAHPTENDGAAPWAKCYVYHFLAPDFTPKLAEPSQIVSIGSGSKVGHYKAVLRKLQTNLEHLMLQQFSPDGAAIAMMATISSELTKFPVIGISDHLHLCLAGRDGIRFGRNDTRIYDDDPNKSFKMPPVATSFDELLSMLSATGISSIEGARC